MSTSFSHAPHIQGPERQKHPAEAPNAALLIDFDNVTMGMRSDLSKELKTLLNSDVIKGKVTVQRAYADWRRYPQYIVPLSEASVDLIFAPAYGSSKKNATDIRMAIDGMELVFTRPEIGTYILLTGDSDFSSLVLKLKEYGKYVIGVGIQESSSDILVQNCDEYYSYTSISGLRKSDDAGPSPSDPWVLVEKAVDRMASRKDVMRSDRLKQVMLELDAGFDEKGLGYSKFSRFLTEAASKGLLQLRKLENGQYEIQKGGKGSGPAPSSRTRDEPSRDGGRRGRTSRDADSRRGRSPQPSSRDPEPGGPPASRSDLQPAYDLLLKALDDLLDDQEGDSIRDSDVKRRMLALDSGFDEAELGFGKFSLFLRQAHDHEVITLRKGEEGNYHVSPGARSAPAGAASSDGTDRGASGPSEGESARADTGPKQPSPPRDQEVAARRLRPRMTSAGSRGNDEPPPILEGQVVGSPGAGRGTGARTRAGAPAESGDGPPLSPDALRLPTDRGSVIKYLSNSYGGVGEKTAESLVDALGADLWEVLQARPSRVEEILPPARAEKVLEGWKADFARRKERYLKEQKKSAPARGGETQGPSRQDGGKDPRRPAPGGGAGRGGAKPSQRPSDRPAAGVGAQGSRDPAGSPSRTGSRQAPGTGGGGRPDRTSGSDERTGSLPTSGSRPEPKPEPRPEPRSKDRPQPRPEGRPDPESKDRSEPESEDRPRPGSGLQPGSEDQPGSPSQVEGDSDSGEKDEEDDRGIWGLGLFRRRGRGSR